MVAIYNKRCLIFTTAFYVLNDSNRTKDAIQVPSTISKSESNIDQ